MLALLQALLEILLHILLGAIPPFLVALMGGAIVATLLWLANFARRDIVLTAGVRWTFASLISALTYSTFKYFVPPLQNLVILFITCMAMGPLADLLVKWFKPHFSPSSKRMRRWVPYAIWGYFWFAALIGWRYGEIGLFFITCPALFVAELGIFLMAGFLLPFPALDLYRGGRDASDAPLVPTLWWELRDTLDMLRYPHNTEARQDWIERRRMGLRCLLTYAMGTNYPYYVVIDEKITRRTTGQRTWLPWHEKLIKRLDGDNFGQVLAGPGIILTGPDQVVVLSTGLKFKGAKGPGIIFTDMSDSPTQVIDLRVQLRVFPVKARTKDGIEVQVLAFAPFQIGTSRNKEDPKPPRLGGGFPYHIPDVFLAIHAQQVEHENPAQAPQSLRRLEWYDLPQLVGERALRKIISEYKFDDLYAPSELHTEPGQQSPRSRIDHALEDMLESELPEFGLRRAGSGIGNLEPVDPRVIKERVEAWKANWKRRIMLRQAAGQAQRVRLIEHARAQAQIDVIVDIGKRIEALQSDGTSVPMDRMAGLLIEILERLAGGQARRQYLPGDIDDVIQQAKQTKGGNDAQ